MTDLPKGRHPENAIVKLAVKPCMLRPDWTLTRETPETLAALASDKLT